MEMVTMEYNTETLQVEPRIKALIEAKGLTLNYFEPMDYTLNIMYLGIEAIKVCSNKFNETLVVENGGEPVASHKNVIEYYTLATLKSAYENATDRFADYVLSTVESTMKNARISRSEVRLYLDDVFDNNNVFNPTELMIRLFELHVDDEEYESISQLQQLAKRALADVGGGRKGSGVKPCSFADVEKSSKKGIIFVQHDKFEQDAIIKFAEIVLGKVKPSEANCEKVVEAGGKNTTEFLKLHYQMNGNMPVTFNSEKDMFTFVEALFKEPEDLLLELFPEMFKDE
jgi:hypothetical protein